MRHLSVETILDHVEKRDINADRAREVEHFEKCGKCSTKAE